MFCSEVDVLSDNLHQQDYIVELFKEKKKEIWLSPMTKAPTPTEKSKKATWEDINATKTSITQRLLTDLGRSVVVTTATQIWVVKLVYERWTFSLTATAVR